MKKNLFGLIALLLFTIPTLSQTEKPIEGELEFLVLTPFDLDEQKDVVYVSFLQTAQLFTFNLTNEENLQQIELVKQSIKNDLPIRVFLFKDSDRILKFEIASEIEIEDYKTFISNQSESDSNSMTTTLTSVIPNFTTLNNLFTAIKNQSCGLSSAPTICNTFRYAVNGCFARAHKMKQTLYSNGYDCQKQFVYGSLAATTGSCCVLWSYHVAILIKVKNLSGVIEERIIDPSLFPSGPVLPLTWRNACKKTTCLSSASITSFANTASNVYYRNPTSGALIYDNNYVNTNCVLTKFKNLSGCNPTPSPSISTCGF